MRALKFLALGFIGWVAYSVLTAKHRVSGAALPVRFGSVIVQPPSLKNRVTVPQRRVRRLPPGRH